MTKPKILFLISEDWYFWSHRLPLAQAMKEKGWLVIIATRVSEFGDQIRSQGFELAPLSRFSRSITNPWREWRSVWEILQIYKRYRPTIVHQVALKPIVYGTLAARFVGVPIIVNALAGLGFLFTSQNPLISTAKRAVLILLRILFSTERVRLIVQNPDDLKLSLDFMPEERVYLIRGSGVDIHHFTPKPEPPTKPVVVLAARMLWDKGVKEFVEAAKIINNGEKVARFVLVGIPDSENPASISRRQLLAWQEEGVVEWWGYQSDMPAVFAQSHIICLPSYREGLPKVLLEAAASGKPIVATDVAGCKEIVRHGVNGFLVPARSSNELASALSLLIEDSKLRQSMGEKGREIVEQEFSQEKVVQETLALYDEALNSL